MSYGRMCFSKRFGPEGSPCPPPAMLRESAAPKRPVPPSSWSIIEGFVGAGFTGVMKPLTAGEAHPPALGLPGPPNTAAPEAILESAQVPLGRGPTGDRESHTAPP